MKSIIFFIFIFIFSINLKTEDILPVDNEDNLNSENVFRQVPISDLPVNIDAVLDETAWEEALRMSLDFEVEPGENIATC